jgi:Helix-turn-helix domain of transposase family ISL3
MARAAKRSRRLWDTYLFPGFRPEQTVRGIFGDPKARVITLKRRSKKRLVDVAVAFRWGGTIASDTRIFLELEVRRIECRRCGKVKQERLDFLADNPFYTKRFAYYVGQRCRAATIKDVAKDLALDWHTVKALDKQYMEAQLKRVSTPSLGRHCRLLPAGEQGLARLRRGAQQQDPRDPAARLWLARRRLPASQNPDVHVACAIGNSALRRFSSPSESKAVPAQTQ